MDESPAPDETRRRDHLRVVSEPATAEGVVAPARPRTIGRVIAQTALIADGAMSRRRELTTTETRSGVGRLLGRFR